MMFVKAFLVGGAICFLAQLLINLTKMTAARILVLFLLIGILLQGLGVYEMLVDFAGAGATVPISGFGYMLAKGVMEGARVSLISALAGAMEVAAFGLTSAILFGYLNAIIFKPKTKKQDIKRNRKYMEIKNSTVKVKETKK